MKIVDKISFSKISDPIRGKDQLRGMGPGYDRSLVSLQATDGRDWKTLIGPESITSLAGIQYDEEGNPVGSGSPYQPYVSPIKGLRASGAWTNLFTNVTPTAETKSLTAQKYCLQVFGTGASATCSYGTATESTPLIFTATAGNTTFTPTSCAKWMLVADGGYVRDYIPPGITNSASSSTTGGGGTNTLMDEDMLECLLGKTDGVELAGSDLTGWAKSYFLHVPNTTANSFTTTQTAGLLYGPFTVGDRIRVSVSGVSDATLTIRSADAVPPTSSTTLLDGFGTIEWTVATGKTYLYFRHGVAGTSSNISFSIQRLLPSVFTSVAAVYCGFSSSDLPVATFNLLNIGTANDLAYLNVLSGPTIRYPRTSDGTTGTGAILTSWNRDEIHLIAVQTNAAGTQFRTGIRRYTSAMVPIDALTWGAWAAYDGSLNPLTHLRLALNGTIPLGFKLVSLSSKSLSDTDILKQLRYIR